MVIKLLSAVILTAVLIHFVEVEGMSQEAACEILCPATEGRIDGRARGRLPPPTRPPWTVGGRARGQLPPPTRPPPRGVWGRGRGQLPPPTRRPSSWPLMYNNNPLNGRLSYARPPGGIAYDPAWTGPTIGDISKFGNKLINGIRGGFGSLFPPQLANNQWVNNYIVRRPTPVGVIVD